ncbi:T9SS C-terminal target domain-containing protein [candidate division KSB1 bacterium]|nr:T9SS type A sorting domain-containing protein [candidate division KSB1 bacterium]RQW06694.1 MAG: T9SS C-terminal target domain-containing protein [candidate division KSB1 bacterium]
MVNDAQDQEYLRGAKARYYPRPGHYIGENDRRISVQKGEPWGGLGIRVAVRGYQWNHFLFQDLIIWEYHVGNMSDYHITEMALGFMIDADLGNDLGDAAGQDSINMVYLWDVDGTGEDNRTTGLMGFVLLETPAKPNDALDNDRDGLIDEKRENSAGQIVGPTDGIANVDRFLSYYALQASDLRPHWDADEDQDWQDGIDLNNNGVYDIGEFAGHDVGLDGLAPDDINYPGADEGECNHRPDYIPSLGCEPNFAIVDVDESDMLGLSSFQAYEIPPHRDPYYGWFRNDASMWDLLGKNSIGASGDFTINHLFVTFSSGPFELEKGKECRISMAEIHSYDESPFWAPTAEDIPYLYQQKQLAQRVVNCDYSIDRIPINSSPAKPGMSAALKNDQLELSWDSNAEKNSTEPLLNNHNDFEGYKLYRQYQFVEGMDFWSAKELLFACDLLNGISGYFPIVKPPYYLGNDSGIRNSYADISIEAGTPYRYTIVAYDRGITPDSLRLRGFAGYYLSPAESSDELCILIPISDPIDFPWEFSVHNLVASGSIEPEIIDKKKIKSGHTYRVHCHNDTIFYNQQRPVEFLYVTNGITVCDMTENGEHIVFQDLGNQPNSLFIPKASQDYLERGYIYLIPGERFTNVFDGIRLKVHAHVIEPEFDELNSGWVTGTSPIKIVRIKDQSERFAWDYDLVFTSNDSAFVSQIEQSKLSGIRDENGNRVDGRLLTHQAFDFYVQNMTLGDHLDGIPLTLEMVVHDMNRDRQYTKTEDRVYVGYLDSDGRFGTIMIVDFSTLESSEHYPQPGDVYHVRWQRPFGERDKIEFIIDPQGTIVNYASHTPSEMSVRQNYPNPFNPITTIPYDVSETARVEIDIYNMLGQHVQKLTNKIHVPGRYTIEFDGSDLSSGVYLFRMKVNKFMMQRKMLLLK